MYDFMNNFIVSDESSTPVYKEDSTDTLGIGINMDFFTSDKAKNIEDVNKGITTTPTKPDKKKVTRKKVEVVPAEDDLPMVASNQSYLDTYGETNNMLRGAIAQTDMLSMQVQEDIDSIRASKTMKSKYTYLTNLVGTASSLIGTKIQAIKEINGNITQGHTLDLRRAKDLKTGAEAEKNDDQKLMQMYDAFINMPIGNYTPQAPSLQALTTAAVAGNNGLGVVGMTDNTMTTGYDSFVNGSDPVTNRARLEANQNIKTVVMYNADTGDRWFEVIDITTNQPIPNVEKPGDFLLADTNVDVHHGVATNRNINATWDLVVLGGKPVSEY